MDPKSGFGSDLLDLQSQPIFLEPESDPNALRSQKLYTDPKDKGGLERVNRVLDPQSP